MGQIDNGGSASIPDSPTLTGTVTVQDSILVPTPDVDGEAANKSYVDGVAGGVDWKDSVRVATTAALTLASDFENGDTVDGVALATGDRILIKDQAAASANGIYTVNASGAPTRAVDANTSAEVTSGMAVWVTEGTTNGDTGWVLTTNDPITLGTTGLSFTQFSGSGQITAGAGLTKTGNTIDVVAGSSKLTVAADSIDVNEANFTHNHDASYEAAGAVATHAGLADPHTGYLLESLLDAKGDLIAATADNTPGRLALGTDTHVLTADSSTATGLKWSAPSAGGGQTTVTRIVAASGGDHTTLGAAITAASAGDVIYIRPGTYAESAITSTVANLTIIGENPETVILSGGANVLSFAGTNQVIQGIKFTFTTGGLTLTSAATNSRVINCNLTKSSTGRLAGILGADSKTSGCNFTRTTTDNTNHAVAFSGQGGSVSNNTFNVSTGSNGNGGVFAEGNYTSVQGNYFNVPSGAATASNFSYALAIEGAYCSITGNSFFSADTDTIAIGIGNGLCAVTGNTIQGSFFSGIKLVSGLNTVSGNFIYITAGISSTSGIWIPSSINTVTGNYIRAGTTAGYSGMRIDSGQNVLTGNTIYLNAIGFNINGSQNTIQDNHLPLNGTALSNTANISGDIASNKTHVWNNRGMSQNQERRVVVMKNTSGANMVNGYAVIQGNVATADEITTTTIASDYRIFGIAYDTNATTSQGWVVVEGYHPGAKVDGNINIGIGDLLTTHTVTGALRKANFGDNVIAKALGAYSTNDSNGSIPVLVFRPYKLAQPSTIATKTGTYNISGAGATQDNTLLGDATGGAFTMNLPSAIEMAGRTFTIKKIDSSINAVTVDGDGSETIDGATTYALVTQYKYVTVQSDGANWVVVANN